MKKKFFILSIIIIGIIFFINYSQNKKKMSYTIEDVTEEKFFLLMSNNKYGVINKEGNLVIDASYESVEIPNPQRALFVCKNGNNIEILNDKREKMLEKFSSVEAIKLNKIDNHGIYEKSVLKYKDNNKYGLIDFQGKKITKPIYDSIDGFEYNEGLLLVKKSDKYGLININGAEILKAKYDEILCDEYYSENKKYQDSGYVVGDKTSSGMRYGYINRSGKVLLKNNYNKIYRLNEKEEDSNVYIVAFENGRAGVYENSKKIIPHEYEDIVYCSLNDLLIVKKNQKYGMIKLDGTQIVPNEYDNIFIEGELINAQKQEKTDIYDTNGNKKENYEYVGQHSVCDGKFKIVSTADGKYKIINNQKVTEDDYQYIQYLLGSYFTAIKNQKSGIIDADGNTVIDFNYDVVQKVNGFDIVELLDDQGNTILLDKNLDVIYKAKYANIFFVRDYIKIQSTGDTKYFDYQGKEMKNTEVYTNNALYAYKENQKWGYKDKSGNIVVAPKYDMATEFNEYGYAGVKESNKWGVVNSKGEVIVKPSFELDDFTNPSFIKQYYKIDLGYGESYFVNVNEI